MTIREELKAWQKKMLRRPGLLNSLSKAIQTKINSWIPEKVHKAITAAIKQMVRGVLFGAKHTSTDILTNVTLKQREDTVQKKLMCIEKLRLLKVGSQVPAAFYGGLLISQYSLV